MLLHWEKSTLRMRIPAASCPIRRGPQDHQYLRAVLFIVILVVQLLSDLLIWPQAQDMVRGRPEQRASIPTHKINTSSEGGLWVMLIFEKHEDAISL